tara:strand:+ start:231 stop:464 length:234 start_codon:yes stop_codon:yes gene_type:complete
MNFSLPESIITISNSQINNSLIPPTIIRQHNFNSILQIDRPLQIQTHYIPYNLKRTFYNETENETETEMIKKLKRNY